MRMQEISQMTRDTATMAFCCRGVWRCAGIARRGGCRSWPRTSPTARIGSDTWQHALRDHVTLRARLRCRLTGNIRYACPAAAHCWPAVSRISGHYVARGQSLEDHPHDASCRMPRNTRLPARLATEWPSDQASVITTFLASGKRLVHPMPHGPVTPVGGRHHGRKPYSSHTDAPGGGFALGVSYHPAPSLGRPLDSVLRTGAWRGPGRRAAATAATAGAARCQPQGFIMPRIRGRLRTGFCRHSRETSPGMDTTSSPAPQVDWNAQLVEQLDGHWHRQLRPR